MNNTSDKLVKRSWPKQHCVWVWSKSTD